MTIPAVRIVSRMSLLASGVASTSKKLSTFPAGVLAFLERESNPIASLGIDVDCDRIARMGPIVDPHEVQEQDRFDLWCAAVDWLRQQRTRAVQIVCDPPDLPILSRLGLPLTTEITELARTSNDTSGTDDLPNIVVTRGPVTEDLVELVLQTLTGSQDVPEAIPFRSFQGVIDSLSTLESPLIVCGYNPDAACGLLIGELRSDSTLVRYLGVKPHNRQQGWGSRLLMAAIRSLKCANFPVLTHVDSRNIPALHLYQRLGFVPQRSVPLIFHTL